MIDFVYVLDKLGLVVVDSRLLWLVGVVEITKSSVQLRLAPGAPLLY